MIKKWIDEQVAFFRFLGKLFASMQLLEASEPELRERLAKELAPILVEALMGMERKR